MAIQSAVTVDLVIAPESTFGVPPDAGTGQAYRRVSSSLALVKDTFQSNEVRPNDLQVSDARHGMRRMTGQIEGELSIKTYDALIEACLGGSWTSGVTVAPAQFATGVTIADGSGNTSTLTFAGGGSLITQGFKVGDIVRATGLATAGNNNQNLRIIALTATVMTVAPKITAATQQASGWAVTVAGKKALMGTTARSFGIEQIHDMIDMSELFLGCRTNAMTIRVPPNGMTTISFDMMGLDGSILENASSPYFTTIADPPNTDITAGLDGALRLAGADQGIVTSLDLTVSNNMSSTAVIGANVAPDIFQGRKTVSGTLSAFLKDSSLMTAFSNESEVDLTVLLPTASGTPQDFISLNVQRLKLNGATKTIGAEGGVIVQYPFTALLKSGGAATAYDQTTIAIQRSNVN